MLEKKKINSKSKGNRIELKISKILSKRFKKDFFRTVSSGAYTGGKNYERTKTMNKNALEAFSGDIVVPLGFIYSIEIKGRASFNLWDFWNEGGELLKSWIPQTEFDSGKVGLLPMLIVVVNRKAPWVMFKNPDYTHSFRFGDYNIMLLSEYLTLPDSLSFK